MAINDVSLTSGMRSNLLSLQETVTLLNRTQNRLATGKKVNTAIDNPVSYFASQALNARAATIDSLKDAMGQSVQTITAADKGITALTSMIEQAKGIAQSALSAASGGTATVDTATPTSYTAGTVSIDLAGMTKFVAGDVDINVSAAGGMTNFDGATVAMHLTIGDFSAGDTVQIGGETFVFTAGAPGANEFTSAAELAAAITGNTSLAALGYSVSGVSATGFTIALEGVSLTNSDVTLTLTTATGAAMTFASAEVAGTAITITDSAGVLKGTYTYGKAGATGFADAAALIAILTSAGYTASSAAAGVVTAAITGTTVSTASISADLATTVTVGTAEAHAADATTLTITNAAGTVSATYTYGMGTFQDAESLVTILTGAGYNTSTTNGTGVIAAITGTTVAANVATSKFTSSLTTAVAVGTAEVMTFNVSGTTLTGGVGGSFTIGATNAETATNLAAAITTAGIGAVAVNGTSITVTVASNELKSLQQQYNTLLDQMDALAQDSGYKGKNLLNADTMAVKFEGATLTVTGFDASTSGLAITTATWAIGGNISDSVNELDNATTTLRSESSKLSSNLSIITVRQSFSTNMVNTLTEGSDKLTLADSNEEGANMLMLQTRQSLSTTALSLSAQAAQSVLKLFG